MEGISVAGIAPIRKSRASRCIVIGAGLVAASLIAGLMVFSWLSAMNDPASPIADARPGVHLNVPHHFRF
jgi:hypothetical protein